VARRGPPPRDHEPAAHQLPEVPRCGGMRPVLFAAQGRRVGGCARHVARDLEAADTRKRCGSVEHQDAGLVGEILARRISELLNSEILLRTCRAACTTLLRHLPSIHPLIQTSTLAPLPQHGPPQMHATSQMPRAAPLTGYPPPDTMRRGKHGATWEPAVVRLLGAIALAVSLPAPAAAATLHGVTPGKSTRAGVHCRLGAPQSGKGTATESFRPADAALKRVVLFYGRGNVVHRACFEPAADLPLGLARLLFEARGKPQMTVGHPFDATRRDGRTAHFDADGVHFYLRGDLVREIWLVVPGERIPAPAATTPKPAPPRQPPKPPTLPGTHARPARTVGRKPSPGSPKPAPQPSPPSEDTPAERPRRDAQAQCQARDTEEFLARQRIRVRKVWFEANARVGEQRGMMVFTDLSAKGCKGQTMMARVRLRHHDGKPVMAAPGAPERFTDARGRFAAPAPDEVLYDPATWSAYQIFLPYDYLALPRGQARHLVIVLTAACRGETNGLEALCTLRMP